MNKREMDSYKPTIQAISSNIAYLEPEMAELSQLGHHHLRMARIALQDITKIREAIFAKKRKKKKRGHKNKTPKS